MSTTIKLFTHATGPNGWKVAAVLEELNLPYEPKYLQFEKNEQKAEEHVKHNPNGRIPTIVDGDVSIWESGASAYSAQLSSSTSDSLFQY